MLKSYSILLFMLFAASVHAQDAIKDPIAGAMLERVEKKYQSVPSVSADFSLTIQKPKLKPEDPDSKYQETLPGKLMLKGKKFKVSVNNQEVICDGLNIWTYLPSVKEVQVSVYEESDDLFSPSRIFSLYKAKFNYQIKERKNWNGKQVMVIELSPLDKKSSFFKIDLGVDEQNAQVLESKIYEKSGVRYIYKVLNQKTDTALPDNLFTFDAAKYPGVEVVDLR